MQQQLTCWTNILTWQTVIVLTLHGGMFAT